MKKEQALSWADKQKALDEESRALMLEHYADKLEAKVAALPEATRKVHEEFKHDPRRCRCFNLAGAE